MYAGSTRDPEYFHDGGLFDEDANADEVTVKLQITLYEDSKGRLVEERLAACGIHFRE